MEKKEIRNSMMKNLKNISVSERDEKSKQIIDKLLNTEQMKSADIIATTMPMEHEINTKYLITACWKMNKSVVVPKCNHETRKMHFYKINSFDDLKKGYFGIQEPIEEKCEEIRKERIDLIIVPGVAYTKNGERLGYGGGYYDRYLEDYNKQLLALAYDIQIIDDLPTEKHDIKMPLVLTESRIIEAI
ncbi:MULTISPECIES: 5-formyltetrahydrofolate cyclo-ligase [Bacillaceae]|uniref:5-formyltetrahydrofolate cyclo-ligase n=1 Tax=Gottfriedia luciferensis TaxID=178774 RepID=A0ABX2ZS62_9BACI|nr:MULTISPECIES: 5-formyltetrahydrofolate cyclo-ligase [Bacillaceae]ODG91347.1 5-formyltetrahydrofolate cyclo-ligase [Gottfriedia luciferensis]PGZ92011.1 5-formyltetrahydrofolate cyclo-ligase [Bacillus sp. AFS029533]